MRQYLTRFYPKKERSNVRKNLEEINNQIKFFNFKLYTFYHSTKLNNKEKNTLRKLMKQVINIFKDWWIINRRIQ